MVGIEESSDEEREKARGWSLKRNKWKEGRTKEKGKTHAFGRKE